MLMKVLSKIVEIDYVTYEVFLVCLVMSMCVLFYYLSVLNIIAPWFAKNKPATESALRWEERKRHILERKLIRKITGVLIFSGIVVVLYFVQ